jgi:copper chaperone CopZ
METSTKKLVFKTNINCGGCISAVTPFLNNLEGVDHWEVDTDNKDKILTVQSTGISEQQVIETVQKAGFKIEQAGF